MKKKFVVLNFVFYVSDLMSLDVLGVFVPLHLALGPNR